MAVGKEGARQYETFRDQSAAPVDVQQNYMTVDNTRRNTSVSKNANASDTTANLQRTTADPRMAQSPAPIGRD